MEVGLGPAPSAEPTSSEFPALHLLGGLAWSPRAVFPRDKHARDEGIYLPDLTFTLNRQKVSQELLSLLINQHGS